MKGYIPYSTPIQEEDKNCGKEWVSHPAFILVRGLGETTVGSETQKMNPTFWAILLMTFET